MLKMRANQQQGYCSLLMSENITMLVLHVGNPHEAFRYRGHKEFVQIDYKQLFPYLLVNIGSGVSMDKGNPCEAYNLLYFGASSTIVTPNGLVTGSTFLILKIPPLCATESGGAPSLLLGVTFPVLEIDHNELFPYLLVNIESGVSMVKVDGDGMFERVSGTKIGGGTCWRLGKVATKVIAYLNALRFGLNWIFLEDAFYGVVRTTMETISFAVQFWSRGAAKAMFLCHEGFSGTLGAFMSYAKHRLDDLMVTIVPYTGGKIHVPPLVDLNEKCRSSFFVVGYLP